MKNLFLVGLLVFGLLLFGCTSTEQTKVEITPASVGVLTASTSATTPVSTQSQEQTELISLLDFTNLVKSNSDYDNVIGRTIKIKGIISTGASERAECVNLQDETINGIRYVAAVSRINSETINKTVQEQDYPATTLHVFTGTIKRAPNPYGCPADRAWTMDEGWYLELTSVGEGTPQ